MADDAADDADAPSSEDVGTPRGGGEETHANASDRLTPMDRKSVDSKFVAAGSVEALFDDDATVLTSSGSASSGLASSGSLHAEEFPQGLSPRELAFALRGELLGHFHLQEFIGGGGMGAVFKALDTTLDRIVAVKVLASHSLGYEDLQRRFLVEAQSTARLDHPNIARIHFVGRDRGLPYIVFEYIDGVNLRDLVVNHGPIPLGDALSFACQIGHALAHAWEKEVVHRDIKPSNILVTREGQAKLVDMGLARLYQEDAKEHELTNTGVTLGTFDYISPEQARDPREVDTRSDIYSLGCTLFYMLAGHPPFAQGTAVQKLLQHQDQSPPNLAELRPEIPESVAAMVGRMLAKLPEDRPQTPSELVVECNGLFRELGLQPPQSLTPLPRVQPVSVGAWRQHVPWALPLGVLLALGGWLGLSSPDSAEVVAFPELHDFASSGAEEVNAVEKMPEKTLPLVEDILGTAEGTLELESGVEKLDASTVKDAGSEPSFLQDRTEAETGSSIFLLSPEEEPTESFDAFGEAGLGFDIEFGEE